jgi:hypothetical protein
MGRPFAYFDEPVIVQRVRAAGAPLPLSILQPPPPNTLPICASAPSLLQRHLCQGPIRHEPGQRGPPARRGGEPANDHEPADWCAVAGAGRARALLRGGVHPPPTACGLSAHTVRSMPPTTRVAGAGAGSVIPHTRSSTTQPHPTAHGLVQCWGFARGSARPSRRSSLLRSRRKPRRQQRMGRSERGGEQEQARGRERGASTQWGVRAGGGRSRVTALAVPRATTWHNEELGMGWGGLQG